MTTIDRRAFLGRPPRSPPWPRCGRGPAAAAGKPKKAVYISMLPKELGLARALPGGAATPASRASRSARSADAAEAEEIREAAAKAGLEIHSVMNADHWKFPLSSADPEVVTKSVAGMETSLRNAKLWGCDSVLLVPAVVNPETSYKDAWTRSQKVIKERILPLAQELKVIVGIEEVWNKFLLSPLEMARYVDELGSPWAKAYVDVGNMIFYGYPQDWMRTLGPRISRVHIKDFKLDRRQGEVRLDEPRRGRRRLARGAQGARRDRLRRLGHDGDRGRRRRVPEGRRRRASTASSPARSRSA